MYAVYARCVRIPTQSGFAENGLADGCPRWCALEVIPAARSAPQEAADQCHDDRQNDRDEDRAGDGKVEREAFTLDHDIAGKPPEPQPRQRPPQSRPMTMSTMPA